MMRFAEYRERLVARHWVLRTAKRSPDWMRRIIVWAWLGPRLLPKMVALALLYLPARAFEIVCSSADNDIDAWDGFWIAMSDEEPPHERAH